MASQYNVAVGSFEQGPDCLPMLYALLGLLRQADLQSQLFHSQSDFSCPDCCVSICGQSARYLDSWLMSPELCRESFARGSEGSDAAIVFGRIDDGCEQPAGGKLSELCRTLDLPQICIIDGSKWNDCLLPPRPERAAAILLDRVSPEAFPRLQTLFESLWGVPVLGSLPPMPRLRSAVRGVSADRSPCGEDSSADLCHRLATRLAETFRPEIWKHVASRTPRTEEPSRVFVPSARLAGMHVAVAYDQAFRGYFPDVLELLELQGAMVSDFSPLADETLPPGTNVVYFGCGHPERYAEQLGENHCMKLALLDHVHRGGRLYAEGGGLAFLCDQLVLATGQSWPMVGLFPAVAHQRTGHASPQPVEVALAHDHWLGSRGCQLRGYMNRSWTFEPLADLDRLCAESGKESMLVGEKQAVGSQFHINFAPQLHVLRRFSTPSAASALY